MNKRRCYQLLKLEGWYDTGSYRFKLSCRFNDILRASEFNDKKCHFMSCFGKGGLYHDQLHKRCVNPHWAIIYTPDKHGNFLGRCFVQWKNEQLHVDKIYGNRLQYVDIEKIMKKYKLNCQFSRADTYLDCKSL